MELLRKVFKTETISLLNQEWRKCHPYLWTINYSNVKFPNKNNYTAEERIWNVGPCLEKAFQLSVTFQYGEIMRVLIHVSLCIRFQGIWLFYASYRHHHPSLPVILSECKSLLCVQCILIILHVKYCGLYTLPLAPDTFQLIKSSMGSNLNYERIFCKQSSSLGGHKLWARSIV